ncbi:hypothetical protein [Gymnodinialimonas sp.]
MPLSDPPDVTAFLPMAEPLVTTYTDGRIDAGYCPYLYAASERRMTPDGTALLIGSAGMDGVEFALKRGEPGVWIYHPYDDAWTTIAPDIATFETLWLAGQITV